MDPDVTGERFRERPARAIWGDALWSHAAGSALSTTIAADGCVDVIVRVSSAGSVTTRVHPATLAAHGAFIAAGERVFGIRLRAGFGAPLLQRSERVAQVARERLLPDSGFDELEALVGEMTDEVGHPPAVIRDFLELARETHGSARLSGGRVTMAAERRLQRAARCWLGTTPKTYLRIERARAARDAVREGQPLASVAAQFGYADQAHLTREFRTFLGVTPRDVRPVGILQDRKVRGA